MSDNNASANPGADKAGLGLAGSMAKTFIHSPLSPLILIACLAMGILGLFMTPRQEDPQISVPMVDIFVQYPGASSRQVASLATDPLERMMSEIPGVKHVYSASRNGSGMVTVQFEVGEQMGPSLVKLYDKLASNLDKIPPGVSRPLVKPKGVDDVPIVTLTLWSEQVDDALLRQVALEMMQRLKEVPNTSQSFVTGGRPDEMRVEVSPGRLKGYGISVAQIAKTVRGANVRKSVGNLESGSESFSVYAGRFLKHAADLERLIVGVHQGAPVYLRDVARVTEGPGEARSVVQYFTGPAAAHINIPRTRGASAVTIAIAKKSGSNGVTVASAVLDKVAFLKGQIIPDNIHVAVTRNYGQTAKAKVDGLIFKLFVATGAVVILIFLALRLWQPAAVVAIVIPVVILITVFAAWLFGFTIDRVSLFALIFSIGILVDDAIVVVENIYRRWLMKGEMDTQTTIEAVAEVGNPTILATFTVIAALLPMGFVSGMMGPYMAPIPALGSVAMLFSLFAAFIFTPWLAVRIRPSMKKLKQMEAKEHAQVRGLDRLFRGMLGPLLDSPFKAKLFRFGIWGLFMISCALFYTQHVTVKMLPLDNKPEFNVVVNMPDGTALPTTANAVQQLTDKILGVTEVTAVQTYTGTSSPFNFNGLVRHYYLRQNSWHGDIQIQLLDKSERERSSHDIAVEVRQLITPLARQLGARVQIVEMPPGPPVLQTMVAEIYGPDAATREQVARDLTAIFEKAETVTDVDNYLSDPHDVWTFDINQQKAEHRHVSVASITKQLSMLMGGYRLGDVKLAQSLEPRYIVLQAPLEMRARLASLAEAPIVTGDGQMIPLGELGRFRRVAQDKTIFHKDLRPVEYVTGEVAGRLAAPVYAMIEVSDLLKDYRTPDGVELSGEILGPPGDSRQSAFEWTGEWTVTYETFRDMGLAFCAAMVLIYMLVVWEFGNFRLPGIIMAPIPLTLIGIIPGHWLFGAEFTATSMIGWIALAGIIVRNSILLVDFAKHAIQNGVDKREAVIQAVVTRTRPILITAFALVAGSSVILSDPIFNGMAISLLFGVLVSTVLTLFVIPLACVRVRNAYEVREEDPMQAVTGRAAAAEVAAKQNVSAGVPAPSFTKRIGSILLIGFYLLRMPFFMAAVAVENLFGKAIVAKLQLAVRALYAIPHFLWMFAQISFKALFGSTPQPAYAASGVGRMAASKSGAAFIDQLRSAATESTNNFTTDFKQGSNRKHKAALKTESRPAPARYSRRTAKAQETTSTTFEKELDTMATTATKKRATAKKAPARKTTTKKTTPRKTVAKKAVTAKKTTARKTVAKKAAPAKKVVAKKKVTKKAVPVKKAATKKTVAKRTVAKKAAPARKKVAKKAVAKKTMAKKAAPARKKVSKKTAAKKTAPAKRAAAKKAVPAKKVTAGKTAAKKTAPVKKTTAKKKVAKKAVAAKKTAVRKTVVKKAAPAKKRTVRKATAGKTLRRLSDDLTQIKGIGPQIEKKLNAAKITSYKQISGWKRSDVAKFDDDMNFSGRILRDNWITQAKQLHKLNGVSVS